MKRLASIVAAALLAAGSAAAQRTVVLGVYGGGADHLADLTTQAPVASFNPGYSLGATAGYVLNERLAVHGDFTFTRNPAWGAAPFAGQDVNRFFVGAHLEYRYPLRYGLTPFVFGGAGVVAIDQLGLDTFRPTTKAAVMYGGGVFYAVPRTRVEVFGEVKGFTYHWNMAGFHRNMIDVAYGLGVSYRFDF